jgi:hypothetical protein
VEVRTRRQPKDSRCCVRRVRERIERHDPKNERRLAAVQGE